MNYNIFNKVLFSMIYKSNRRKHSHRCRACWKIIQESEEILLLRHQTGSWALHEKCKYKSHTEQTTWACAFHEWAKSSLEKLGYSEELIEKAKEENDKRIL